MSIAPVRRSSDRPRRRGDRRRRGHRSRHRRRAWPHSARRSPSGNATPDTCAAAAEEIGALGITTDVRDSAAGGRRTGADRRRTRTRDDPGEQRGWRVPLVDPRHQRKRLGRAVQVQSAARVSCAPSGWPAASSRPEAVGQHHQRHVDRRRPRRTRLRDVRRGQGRRDQLHQDRGPRTRTAWHPGQRTGTRHHHDRRDDADRAAGGAGTIRATRCRWGAPGTSTRWPAPQSFSRRRCRATSRDRPSTSTAAPQAAGGWYHQSDHRRVRPRSDLPDAAQTKSEPPSTLTVAPVT